jgi:hypothetical protein
MLVPRKARPGTRFAESVKPAPQRPVGETNEHSSSDAAVERARQRWLASSDR